MSLFAELKDRKVFRVAAVYLVVAWLILQIVAVVSVPLLLPDWFARVVILLLTLGFPFALIISWAFDVTPAGVERATKGISGKPLAIGVIAITAIVVGFILAGFNSGDSEPEEIASVESPEAIAPLVEVLEEEGVLPNSVAVLLCDNLSPDPNDAYFAAGIHEEILNQLVKLSALNVIARTSVMKYAETNMAIPEIAAELNVGSVMECSVRFAGTSILVTAQLIDPQSNSHLWSETYPGDIGDLSGVFAMQADIAMNIANALNAEFSIEEQQRIATQPTQSAEAYGLFLKAISSARSGGSLELVTLSYLDEALSIDPDFALARAFKALSITIQLRFGIDRTPARELAAYDDAEQALSINPELAEAHMAMAALHVLNWRKSEAELAYQNALDLYPNSKSVLADFALFERAAGNYEKAIQLQRLGTNIDPNDPLIWHQLAVSYRQNGNFEAAQLNLELALSINSELVPSQFELALIMALRGEKSTDSAEDLRIFESTPAWENVGFLRAMSAVVYSKMGFVEDAVNTLEAVRELHADGRTGGVSLALAYLAVNENDLAFDALRQALDEEDQEVNATVELKFNAVQIDALEEPRFVELRNRMGFQD